MKGWFIDFSVWSCYVVSSSNETPKARVVQSKTNDCSKIWTLWFHSLQFYRNETKIVHHIVDFATGVCGDLLPDQALVCVCLRLSSLSFQCSLKDHHMPAGQHACQR